MCSSPCGKSSPSSTFQKYVKRSTAQRDGWLSALLGTQQRACEIFEGLKEMGEHFSKSGLYYHLSELEKADIIELAEYRKVGGGAPEKVWKLKTKEIRINF